MVVTIVCDVLGRANNGTTIAALNLIDALKKRGHTVRVVCGDPERKGQDGFYVVPNLNLGPMINKYLKKNGVSLAKADRRVIEQAIDGADVVHFMMPFALGAKAARLAHKRGIPVTAGFHCQAENFTSHVFMKDFAPANYLFYRFVWLNSYRYCARIHYPTQFIRDTFENAIRRSTPGEVISNGVNSAFRPVPVSRPKEYADRFVIHFTGRLSKEKTHRVLIDAVNRSKHRERIQLEFAGDGPLREKLQKRGRKLPNPPRIGFYSREELVKKLNTADLYVHPAEIEIEAIACLEAISCGLVPVIANSKRSATRYFAIDGRNLFKNKSAKELAARIDYWIEHPQEREEMCRLYSGFAELHEFENCMDRMEQMIAQAKLMHGHRSREDRHAA